MRVSTFEFKVAEAGAESGMEMSIHPETFSGNGFDIDVTPDNDVLDAAQPSTIDTQFAGYEILVDDVALNPRDVLSVDEGLDLGNVIDGFGFTLPIERPGGRFGSPFHCVGPSLGKKRIDLNGLYRVDGSLRRVPIFKDGIASEQESSDSSEGCIDSFSCLDRGGRFDGTPISKIFPAGHGLPRGRVLEICGRAAGETKFRLEPGGKMNKELQIINADWLASNVEIAEVENRKIGRDADGCLTNRQMGKPRSDEPDYFDFGPRDMLRIGGFKYSAKADVITKITATTQALVIDPDCVVVPEVETVYERGFYAPRVAKYIQNSDGTYDPQSQPPAGIVKIITKKTETTTLRKCGVTIMTMVKTWEWRNPQAARYSWSSADQAWKPLDCYTDDNTAEFAPAYRWPAEKFILSSVEMTSFYYNFPGFDIHVSGGWMSQISSTWEGYDGTLDSPVFAFAGNAQGSVTFSWNIYGPRGARKARDLAPYPLTPWEEVEPTDGALIYGNGDACATGNDAQLSVADAFLPTVDGQDVKNDYETLCPTGIVILTQRGNANKEKIEDVQYTWGWNRRKGEGYLWGDENQYSSSVELFEFVESDTTRYAKDGENTHSEITDFNLLDGTFDTDRSTSKTGVEGSLPPMDRLDLPEVDPSLYADEAEQAALNLPAKRGQTRELTHTEEFPFLLTCHSPKYPQPVNLQWAEDDAELKAACIFIAEEDGAMPVTFTLPANFFLRKGMCGRVRYPRLNFDFRVRIKSVKRGLRSLPLTTVVEALYYAW